ncbi:MAG: ZIP family metal transporter [Candidatus Buchananbacteria bacterium]|jgi:zinc and cadmium transporter
MSRLYLSIIGAVIVGLVSFVGALSLLLRENFLHKIIIYLVAFSAGALMGGAFFHLLPEALDQGSGSIYIFSWLLLGFCLFYIMERLLRWHHCHNGECESHAHLGWMNIIGGGIHNMIDGMIIYAAFSIDVNLGWSVLLSIILHEIPQELGDFGVLIYSGFSKAKALFYNFISAMIAVIGVIFAYLISNIYPNFHYLLLPVAAGGFIYIAASDLIPELHKDSNTKRSFIYFLIFAFALAFMFAAKVFFE